MTVSDTKKNYRKPEAVTEEFLPGSLICDSLTSSTEGGLEGFDFDPI